MRKMGVSNELFYLTQTGEDTYTINYRFIFKDDIRLELLKKAAGEALANYPEFSMRPVVSGSRVYAKEQHEPVPFKADDGTYYDFGSDDTNGYMFCFRYKEKEVTFSFFHGLTDIKGILTYLTEVLYRYATACGVIFPKEEREEIMSRIRFAPPQIKEEESGRMFDPYYEYGREGHPGDGDAGTQPFADGNNCKGEREPDIREIFDLSECCDMDYSVVHYRTIELRTSDFVEKTKELGTSFMPLLVEIASSALANHYDTGDKRIVAMVPVDMRRTFGCETLVNFSDGVMIPYDRDRLCGDVRTNCRVIKDTMKSHITREYLQRTVREKVKRVLSAEDGNSSLDGVIAKMSAGQKKHKYSYILTYPGQITFSKGIDAMLADVRANCRPNFFTIAVNAFNDRMRLEVIQRGDDPVFARCVYEGLKSHGIEACLTDNGRIYADRLNPQRLTCAETESTEADVCRD